MANREQNPAAVFGDRVRSINTLDHYSTRPPTTADIAKLDPKRMLAYYRARFANAANFTFFFAGAFTVDDITPFHHLSRVPALARHGRCHLAGHAHDVSHDAGPRHRQEGARTAQ